MWSISHDAEMKKFDSLEKSIEDTFYREMFFPCKTIVLQSVDGIERRFVECSEAAEHETDKRPCLGNLDVALHNTVRRLLAEKEYSFFFPEDDASAQPVMVDYKEYYLRYEDRTDQWPNHYFLRTRKPIVGFKGVTRAYKSSYAAEKNGGRYACGESVITDEIDMLKLNTGSYGCYFSPDIEKALYYARNGGKLLLVVAFGLVFVKNHWNDLAASKLTVVRELTKEEIDLLHPDIHMPKYIWKGKQWSVFFDEEYT